MQLSDNKIPSNKVGFVFILVVLVVAATIFGTKIKDNIPKPLELKNVELVIERKNQENLKSGDSDNDGLVDWLEEFYKSDPKNSDTDGDGTSDGEEVEKDRDPSVAGPNDPLITRKDLINTEANFENFVPGTVTDKVSVELFSEYLMLKKQGILKPEDEARLVEDLSKKVAQSATLKPKYAATDLSITESTKNTITIYGDRTAQVSLDAFIQMDTYKYLKENQYIAKIAQEYKVYAQSLSQVTVPTVFEEVHLALINQIYNTSVLFDSMINADSDPLSSLVIMTQYQNISLNEDELYTILSDYFKNNGIIFDTETTRNFWKNFGN